AFRLERGAQVGVELQQRAGNAVAGRAGLDVRGVAGDITAHARLFGPAADGQRLRHGRAQGFEREINVKGAAVDGDLAAAGREADAGNGGLATAGAEEFDGFRGHNKNYLAGASTAGVCASWLCFGPLNTFNLVSSTRPRRFFGI